MFGKKYPLVKAQQSEIPTAKLKKLLIRSVVICHVYNNNRYI